MAKTRTSFTTPLADDAAGILSAGIIGRNVMLPGIGAGESARWCADLVAGRRADKPGWVRLNVSQAMGEATVRPDDMALFTLPGGRYEGATIRESAP